MRTFHTVSNIKKSSGKKYSILYPLKILRRTTSRLNPSGGFLIISPNFLPFLLKAKVKGNLDHVELSDLLRRWWNPPLLLRV